VSISTLEQLGQFSHRLSTQAALQQYQSFHGNRRAQQCAISGTGDDCWHLMNCDSEFELVPARPGAGHNRRVSRVSYGASAARPPAPPNKSQQCQAWPPENGTDAAASSTFCCETLPLARPLEPDAGGCAVRAGPAKCTAVLPKGCRGWGLGA
jgi:hypothetical protein